MKAQILSHWIETDGTLRPAINDKFKIQSFEDITGQSLHNLTTAPNSGVFKIQATKVVIDQIDADPEYVVLSRSDQADRKPSRARLDKIRARLRRLVKGERITVEAANRIMGSDLTKVQIARRIAEQIKAL